VLAAYSGLVFNISRWLRAMFCILLRESRSELRLAVISPFLDRQHGTESCIIEQIERLAFQYGWEIHVYSQRVNQVQGLRPHTEQTEKASCPIVWHRVSDITGPHLLRYLWWFFANHVRRWRDQRSDKTQIDLIYSPGINCLDADVIVVHIVFHEFFFRVRSDLKLRQFPLKSWYLIIHRKLYYKLAMLLENKVYRDPRVRLVAVSSLVAHHLERHFQRTDVAVIPNGIDTLRFTPDTWLAKRPAARRSFRYSGDDFVLLLIGNDWKKKGLDSLLRAFVILHELPLCLLVVGSDDPRLYQPQLAEIVSRDRVRFETPSPDVLSFYAAADVYVGPSLEDAFGLPILEAMACGLPVIASIHAGASEFVRDGETGLLLSDPRDPSEIARLVQKLFADGSLRRKLGLAASQYVQANCGWDQNVSKTQDFLETALRDLRHE
jgi:glycosyltransferase involved in cell wall biosynthesis